MAARRLAPPPGVYDYSRAPPCDLTRFYDSANDVDFVANFPVLEENSEDPDDYGEGGLFFLSPRMAYKLHQEALSKGEMLRDDPTYRAETLRVGNGLPELPPVVRPFLGKQWWINAYIECLNRLGARLGNGLPPSPNCTGEEMALHQLLCWVEDLALDTDYYEDIGHYPETSKDDDYEGVREGCMDDEDVLMLYDTPSAFVSAALPDAAFLDPAQWFFAFKSARVEDHLPLPDAA